MVVSNIHAWVSLPQKWWKCLPFWRSYQPNGWLNHQLYSSGFGKKSWVLFWTTQLSNFWGVIILFVIIHYFCFYCRCRSTCPSARPCGVFRQKRTVQSSQSSLHVVWFVIEKLSEGSCVLLQWRWSVWQDAIDYDAAVPTNNVTAPINKIVLSQDSLHLKCS